MPWVFLLHCHEHPFSKWAKSRLWPRFEALKQAPCATLDRRISLWYTFGMPKTPMNVRLSDEGRRLLELLAKKLGRPMTIVIEDAIRAHASANKVK